MKVRQKCHTALKGDHEFINTVQEGTEETHAQVILNATLFLSFFAELFCFLVNSVNFMNLFI
jgi:hypothetical protein